MAFLEFAPRQTIPFSAMTPKPQIRTTGPIQRWLGRVLAVVEHENLSADRLSGYNERILGHITSPVDLPFVIDLLNNLDLAAGATEAAEVGAVVVVVASIVLGVLEGELDLGKHEVIGLVLGGVGAQDHLLNGVVLAGRLVAAGKPFDGERRPLEGVGNDQIVEERCVLFPNFVLFVDQPLLNLPAHFLLVLSHLSVALNLGFGFGFAK